MNIGLVLLVSCILPCLVRSQSGDDIGRVNKIDPGEDSDGHLLHKNHSSILKKCVSYICVAAVSCKDVCIRKCPHCTFMEFSNVSDLIYTYFSFS